MEIKDARHLWGKDTAVTEELIRQENGNKKLKVAVIGPAGERLARIAAVINDRGRAAARSGLGAVMGSKNLKAVACTGTMRPEILDKPAIQALMKEMIRETKENPSGMFYGLSHGGTPGAMVMHMHDHDVPIKNWGGNNVEDFPESKWDVGGLGRHGASTSKKKYACTGCPVACGSMLSVEDGKYPVRDAHKPEYETLAAFGPMCLNDNMESLIYANELCNLYGLDTISAGATVAFAIECYENGLISKEDTDGLELTWGNSDAHVAILEKMCRARGHRRHPGRRGEMGRGEDRPGGGGGSPCTPAGRCSPCTTPAASRDGAPPTSPIPRRAGTPGEGRPSPSTAA